MLNVVESGPSTAARLLTHATRLTVRTALKAGSRAMHLPWPYGAIEFAASALPRSHGRTTVQLRNTTAQLIHAKGVARTGRVILYLHGGAFMACGVNTHASLITRLSRYSNAPVLAVDYRMIPKHSVGAAIYDCLDAYHWLRRHYEPEQIALAGDSAGGYLALALATHLPPWESPAALALLSPLLQLTPGPKKAHPNIKCDAMFGAEAFDALIALVRRANGGGLYEPLEGLTPHIPPTLIHVSGHEVLLHDARLAAERLGGLGVPVEVRVWPGQIHVFQIAAPLIPEANRSLQLVGSFISARTGNYRECYGEHLTNRTATVG